MADQASVFEDQNQAAPVVPATPANPSSDPILDTLLDSIKNERGERKYANVQEALKGLANAQAFIPDLQSKLTLSEQKLAHLESELSKRQSLEDTLAAITTAKQVEPGTPPVAGLDEQKVTSLVTQALANREAQNKAIANETAVNDALKAKYGDKVLEVVQAKALQLGLTLQDLGQLSQRSPQAVLAYFDAKPSTGSLQTSSVNTTSLQSQPAVEGVKRPEKSVLAGASTKTQLEHMREHKRAVYAKHGIEE